MVMQGKEVWTNYDLKGLVKHVWFKGGSTTTQSRTIPNQTQNEATLENGLMNYDTTGLNNASNVLNSAISSLGNTTNVDWNSLLNGYNSTMSEVSSGYNDLANGTLPTSYATNRQQALNSDLTGTVGSAISNLGSRGILNSSVTNNSLNNISQNASDTLAKNYSSDLSTEANLLGQKASNASNILNNNATAEQNSYYKPSQLFNYASQLSTPAQNMYNTMYSGRMGTGGTTTTQSGGGNNVWGAVGSIGSLFACFVSVTRIIKQGEDNSIEDIVVGDKVYSFDDNDRPCIETVLEVTPPRMSEIVRVILEDGTAIETTESQRFYTSPWFEYVGRMEKPAINYKGNKLNVVKVENTGRQELVYDLVVSGRNIFFAENIAVEGFGD